MTQNEYHELNDRLMRTSLLLGQSIALNYRLAELLESYGALPDEIIKFQKEIHGKISKLYYGVD
jgi:hypothetical protein